MLNSLILKTVEPLTKIYLMIGRQIQNNPKCQFKLERK